MRTVTNLAAVIILVAGIPQAVVASQANDRVAQKSQKKPESASLTGCVDQQEGQYVLVDDRNLNVITHLEAEGFPVEGFAKHMGQKVTVRGTNSPGGAHPVFRVRQIETVSETCKPQAPEGKK